MPTKPAISSAASPKRTRWAGVPADERTRDRRDLLIEAAFELFGTQGEAATSIRAVCRAVELNARYFYESFVDLDELLGATYDREAIKLANLLLVSIDGASDSPEARTRAGIETVLRFITDDRRRARILFTEGRANPALAARRRATVQSLVAAVAEQGRIDLGHSGAATAADVAAAMFGGAMEELADAWIDGRLGSDLDPVIDDAVTMSMALFEAASQTTRNL